MKQLFKLFGYFAMSAMLLFGCTKEKGNSNEEGGGGNEGGGGEEQEEVEHTPITHIEFEQSSYTFREDAGSNVIPVKVKPGSAKIPSDLELSCKQEGTIIRYELVDEGIEINPRGVGEAELTLSAIDGPAEDASVTVTILERLAKPASVAIRKTGSHFSDGKLLMTEEETVRLYCDVTDDKNVTVQGDSKLAEWTVTSGSEFITVDADGRVTAKSISDTQTKTAKVKVAVKDYASITDEVEIEIAVVSKVTIVRNGANYDATAQAFKVTAGKSITIEATVTNSRGGEATVPLTWTSNVTKVRVDAGKITVDSDADGIATITVKITSKPDVKDQVTVKIIPLPASIEFTGLDACTRGDGRRPMKVNGTISFTYKVLPEGADQTIRLEALPSVSETSGRMEASVSGNKITVKGTQVGSSSVLLRIYSGSKELTTIKNFYVYNYDKNDIKPGDYVYSNGTNFYYKDCGVRVPGQNVYEDANDNYVSNKAISPAEAISGGYKIIGVLGSTSLPDDNDFLKCSLLSQCRDGANATGLYEYNGFRKNKLKGFYNDTKSTKTHGLVIGITESSSRMKWQSTVETVARTNDKKNNIYQYQLRDVVALSSVQEANGYGTYVQYGFINHLILNFYNNHLNNHDKYYVQPVEWIETLDTTVPKFSTSAGTTGWFLPGFGDWNLMTKEEKKVVGTSLYALQTANIGSELSGPYWTPNEIDEDYAYVLLYSTTGSCSLQKQDKNEYSTSGSFKSSQGYVRPVLYL